MINSSLALTPAAARALAASLLEGATAAEQHPATLANQFSSTVYLDLNGDLQVTLDVVAWDGRYGFSKVDDRVVIADEWA